MIQRPSVADLIVDTVNNIESRTGEPVNALKNNLVRILARAFSGQVYDLYGETIFQARQFFPFWAETEYLDRWGSLYGVARQLETFAGGTITATGVDGSSIPIDTILTRIDGVEYSVNDGGTISGGVVDLTISCLTAGSVGNYTGGEPLTFQSPIVGVDDVATISIDGLENGFDRESDDSYRDRIQIAIQTDSRNGRRGDWVAWAKNVDGVSRVWESPKIVGNGSIGVHFTVDGSDRIPNDAKLDEVKSYLESVAPISFKEIVTIAPVELPINFSISISPDTTSNRSIVELAIKNYLFNYNLTTSTTDETIFINYVGDVIRTVAEVTSFTISAPTEDVALDFNTLPVLGVISWL